ncbi:hypothetical protein D3C87_1763020 [compost metagenome]
MIAWARMQLPKQMLYRQGRFCCWKMFVIIKKKRRAMQDLQNNYLNMVRYM